MRNPHIVNTFIFYAGTATKAIYLLHSPAAPFSFFLWGNHEEESFSNASRKGNS
jgi:hypothetical protein